MTDNGSNFNLKGDGKRLYWDGILKELKQFVTEELKLSGACVEFVVAITILY